ncbi:PAS domain-containing protein [Streptomyces sp. NPDC002466]|uniref:PAS domain-containing protein n=1 Tax=Streptomyces sp. NPDC002466 TaxID=3364646 RepID=UPI00368D9905
MNNRPPRGADRLAVIFDALPDGLVIVNSNGTVVDANAAALGMFETPGTALVGRGLLDILPGFESRLLPGSMLLPEDADAWGRAKPARTTARRPDGHEFLAEITNVYLDAGTGHRDPYRSHTDEGLLMLVLRDLTGTLDTEAELTRSQQQTEMILRAVTEGVVGTDVHGRIVLVNPAAAQILGYRASQLGGRELHSLALHSRTDGAPFSYDESPLADTLRSGRKHRVRGQALWTKEGTRVPADITTAPVRDGGQLVGAVMTFTDRSACERLVLNHGAELAERDERHADELDRNRESRADLSARHGQLTATLEEAVRGPLTEMHTELVTLAADNAGHLWPEASQAMHRLAAGHARMVALLDNVLGSQRLDTGAEELRMEQVRLDGVVEAGVAEAAGLIGANRARFTVHTAPIGAEADAERLTTALAHLLADVAGVDSAGRSRLVHAPDSGNAVPAIVVALAQRGNTARIEVRGPYAGGDPVHQPIVRGIVAAHGGVVQAHGGTGEDEGVYVLEVPLGTRESAPSPTAGSPGPRTGTLSGRTEGTRGGGRHQRVGAETSGARTEHPGPTGRRRSGTPLPAVSDTGDRWDAVTVPGEPTGRRRGRPAETAGPAGAEGTGEYPAPGDRVPPTGVGPVAAAAPAERHEDELPAPRHAFVTAQRWTDTTMGDSGPVPVLPAPPVLVPTALPVHDEDPYPVAEHERYGDRAPAHLDLLPAPAGSRRPLRGPDLSGDGGAPQLLPVPGGPAPFPAPDTTGTDPAYGTASGIRPLGRGLLPAAPYSGQYSGPVGGGPW